MIDDCFPGIMLVGVLVVLPIICVVADCSEKSAKAQREHEIKLKMIEKGIHPDAPEAH